MLSKKIKRRLAMVFVLSLVMAALFGWMGSTRPLGHVIAAVPMDNEIWCVDQGEDDFRFFRTDSSGMILGEIKRSVRVDGSYRVYDNLVRDGASVYVLERQADIASDQIQSETVYRLDFENSRLEPVWSLPVTDPTQDNHLDIQVRNGILTCFKGDYRGKQAVGRLLQSTPAGELEEISSFRHDIGIGFTQFYAGTNGNVVFTTPAGEVYKVQGDAQPQKVYPKYVKGNPILHFAVDGEDLVWIASDDGQVYHLDLSSDTRAVKQFSWEERGIDSKGLTGLYLGEEDRFAAVLSYGQAVGLFRGSGDVILSELTVQPETILLRALLGFVLTWAAAVVVYFLARLFFFLTKGKVPIVSKLLAVFLPILIVSLAAMNMLVTGFFQKELTDSQYERMYLLTAQQTATLNANYIKNIEPSKAFDNVYFYEIRAALNLLPGQGTLVDSQAQQEQQVYHSNYFWLYKLVDGKLVSLVCEQDYVGVAVEDRYTPEVAELFYDVARTGQVIRTGFRDVLGDWTILLTPVLDENGQVVAVLETGDTRQSLDYAVEQGVAQLTRLNLGIMALLAVLLSAVIAVSLHPLGILKNRVEEISNGKLGVQAPERGNDEVSEITRVFNAMSRNVEFRDREIRMTSDGYSRFVPAKVFELLEKSSVIDVRLEDQTDVEATVLNCWVDTFDDIARTMRSKEMFRLINQVLAQLVPVVDESGGMVDRFDRAGLLAIYTDQTRRALDAAVTLCQTIRVNRPEETGEEVLPFHVILSAGPAMIGIVGAQRRLEAMTISEHTSFTGFLRPLAAEYGASVLMTGSAAASIDDFESSYHARTIGFVYMRTLDRMERLYDVFDGDDETTRRLKEETKAQFEKGVALFCAHRYYDARLLFVEVLKKNRRDKAAQNYLYLCDTYYRQQGGEEIPVYIREY